MFKEIIQIIHEIGYIEIGMISRKLGFSPETIEDALKILISKGYLLQECATLSAESACIGCSKSGCESETPSTFYKITAKGKEYAQV